MSRVLLACVVIGLVGLAVWGLVRARTRPRVKLFSFIAAAAAAALVATGVVAAAGAQGLQPAQASSTGGVSILSWNTGQVDVPASVIEKLAEDSEADVIVLPEYFDSVATAQLGEWAERNSFQILSHEGSASSVLVSERLGVYTANMDGAPPWAGFVAVPERPGSPRLVIAHLEHARLWSAGLWNEHLDWVASECDREDVVAVGDFNATQENFQNGRLGGCLDGAVALGATDAGTWPAFLPAFLGAQIDRVMTGSQWRVLSFSVLAGYDGAGSDHRPILVHVEKGAS